MNPARLGPVALVAVTVGLVSGCAATTGLTGVTVRQGQVVALVRICDPYTASQVELWGLGNDEQPDFRTWEMSGSSADVELGSLASIGRLIAQESPRVSAAASGGVAEDVRFTMSQLRELSEGDVLVGTETDPPTVLTLAEFDEEVDRLCN